MTAEPHSEPISAEPLTAQELRTFLESHEERLDLQASDLRELKALVIRTAALQEIIIARLEAWTDDEARDKSIFERRVKAIESRLARESADRELRTRAVEDQAKRAHDEALQANELANELATITSKNLAMSEAQARAALVSAPDLSAAFHKGTEAAMSFTLEKKKGRIELGKAAMLGLGALFGALATLAGYLLKR